jgi:hypothetical protein
MATDRTIDPSCPIVITARVAHQAIGACDVTVSGPVPSPGRPDRTGRLAGALVRPATVIEVKPGSLPGAGR